MTKCEYCGKKIGLLAVKYTWLDEQNNRAMHDKCYEKYMSESPEKRKQIPGEKQYQEETKKTSNKMIKSKILGIVIFILAISFTIFAIYGQVTFGFGFSIYNTILFICSYFIGIELIWTKRRGLFHKLLLIFGCIILALYIIMLITTAIVYLTF